MSFSKPLPPEAHYEDEYEEEGNKVRYTVTHESIDLKSDNITYNFRQAFEKALGMDFSELSGKTGAEMFPILENAVDHIIENIDEYKALNPETPRAYGTWIGVLQFLNELKKASKTHPDAVYRISG